MEETDKLIEAHPFASEYAAVGNVFLEGDNNAPHRQVFEDHEINQTRHQKHVQPLVAHDAQTDFAGFIIGNIK